MIYGVVAVYISRLSKQLFNHLFKFTFKRLTSQKCPCQRTMSLRNLPISDVYLEENLPLNFEVYIPVLFSKQHLLRLLLQPILNVKNIPKSPLFNLNIKIVLLSLQPFSFSSVLLDLLLPPPSKKAVRHLILDGKNH